MVFCVKRVNENITKKHSYIVSTVSSMFFLNRQTDRQTDLNFPKKE